MSYVDEVMGALAWDNENIVSFADHDDLWWLRRSQCFAVNCNDWFAWACADLEEIEDGDIDLLKQSMEDAYNAEADDWGLRLFACRKRKQPPMDCWFKSSGYTGSTVFVPEKLETAFRNVDQRP